MLNPFAPKLILIALNTYKIISNNLNVFKAILVIISNKGVHLDFELWKDGNYKYVDPTDVALGKVRLPDYIVSSSKSVEELANEVTD